MSKFLTQNVLVIIKINKIIDFPKLYFSVVCLFFKKSDASKGLAFFKNNSKQG